MNCLVYERTGKLCLSCLQSHPRRRSHPQHKPRHRFTAEEAKRGLQSRSARLRRRIAKIASAAAARARTARAQR